MSHKKKTLIELEKSQGFESGVISEEDVWAVHSFNWVLKCKQSNYASFC